MVAVTTQVSADEGAVRVVLEMVQLPEVTAYVTVPVPEPPVVLKVEVPPALTVVGDATAVMD